MQMSLNFSLYIYILFQFWMKAVVPLSKHMNLHCTLHIVLPFN
jgi:hypothetical protein